MPRYKLILEYDGGRYHGWQAQQNVRSIQGVLQKSAAEIFKGPVEVQGAGRTDMGVHALAQVAHLDAQRELAPDEVQWRLNEGLPPDIQVLSLQRAHPRFHARHDALGRSYLYQISRRRTAFAKRYVYWVKDHLNLEPMQTAVEFLIGMHDFTSFADKRGGAEKMRVLVERAQLEPAGELLLFRIRASHFVWKMVRRLVGALLEVGRGRLSPADLRAMLEQPTNAPAQWTVPPSGLFLEQVLYPGETWYAELAPAVPVASLRRLRNV